MTKRQRPNRLSDQKSPYLQQHAWNPVDWYPWGNEAFDEAERSDRPIFLSIGYSTCHWCHVMERESFEDETTAALLNSRFVPVKVDREEMPDLDRMYMLFVQATTGSGGWPMSVWLTPKLKPFFGGSYFPPVPRWGRPSFREVLEATDHLWTNERERVLASAGSTMQQILELSRQPKGKGELSHAPSDHCLKQMEKSFDEEYGGFGGAPKFPRPALLRFLFGRTARTGDRLALHMALLTVRKMADGGIHDQLHVVGRGGGGFARYSTDEYWHVPHFEKMLYDNAQLADAYLRAWQWTQNPYYAETARDIFNYALCDMTSPDGGFYAAEDADSVTPDNGGELREGAFYLWTKNEVLELLGEEDGTFYCQAYGIRETGNAPDDPHGEFAGKNILARVADMDKLAKRYGIGYDEMMRRIESARALLFEARSKRPRPRRDEKVITAWNGLMISALAKGAAILGDPALLRAAERAAKFILDRLYDSSNGQLKRRWCDGEAAIPGKAADYACMVQGLIDLYEASFDEAYLRQAVALTETQIDQFHDRKEGGFFSTAIDDTLVPIRMKEDEDGAEPSANSVTALNLLRLAEMTGREEFRELALDTIRHYSVAMERNPTSLPLMLVALDTALSPPIKVALAGDTDHPMMSALHKAAFRHDRLGMSVMLAREGSTGPLPASGTTGYSNDKPPAAFVCKEGSCLPPVHDPEALANMLER
jgi:uncharacterized protein